MASSSTASAPVLIGGLIRLAPETNLPAGLAGGVIIAASSSALFWYTGQVLGISGIFGRTWSRRHAWSSWRVPFLAGLLASGTIAVALYPASLGTSEPTLRPAAAAAAGILVGMGTRMSNGCTSGHGVVGLARLSPRSLAAVATFMSTGMAAAYLARAWAPLRNLLEAPTFHESVAHLGHHAGIGAALAALMLGAFAFRQHWLETHPEAQVSGSGTPVVRRSTDHLRDSIGAKVAAGLIGVAFGAGLCLSGMTDPAKVTGFLDMTRTGGWDPTLAAVMGGAVGVNVFTFNWMATHNGPPPLQCTDTAGKSRSSLITIGPKGGNLKIDARLIGGSALFGAGWGLAGICPGPGIVAAAAGMPLAFALVPSMAAGMALHDLIFPQA
jgi:uncharacterized membrane protein YedE/YeeE